MADANRPIDHSGSSDNIAIIGGTGPQGRGLAFRFAYAGHAVILGSRSHDRAMSAADHLKKKLPSDARLSGAENEAAAKGAAIVVIAVPYDGHRELVTSMRKAVAGKIVITCVNPIGFDGKGPYAMEVADGSAAEQAAGLLLDSRVIAAFHHLSAVNLLMTPDGAEGIDDQDVLVCGDDADARAQVATSLCPAIIGRPGIEAGALRMARQLEALTATLISINKRYKAHSGLRITGLY